MYALEQIIITILVKFIPIEQLNAALSDPRAVAILIGALVSISTACLGVFLLLRKMSLTSDAISHTVLLGIVVAFFVMVGLLGTEADLSSPLLVIGAAAAGVLTVILTELVQRSGLVKQDAALGLVFPLLFAIAIIIISRYADDVHLDTDAVLVGEIGVAWANTNSHCFDNCDDVVITPDHPRAEMGRRCINCSSGGITPRDPKAVFEEVCANCGTYSAAEAWRERLIPEPPALVFWPRSLTLMGLVTLLNVGFIALFYKELKLTSFDSALATALGFRPVALNYMLMTLVSVTAVSAFDAVGSVLVVAFFIIPAATAYLLTDRLAIMLLISPVFGALSAMTGYELARGQLLGILPISDVLVFLDRTVGLDGYTQWNSSISASMVIMAFLFFLAAWVLSPRYGLVAAALRRRMQRQQFADQMILGHIYHHQGRPEAPEELAADRLHEHLGWTPTHTRLAIARLRTLNLVILEDEQVRLTPRGERVVSEFLHTQLHAGQPTG
ncbi:MAG: metal ABC transporter permease [Chloroflexi bacterium]|nr:metal ABC transporter permease [Chloroflexota bacterium]